MVTPVVLYLGPSALDGSPIVALATIGSSNVKTGPMVQTWIMRADVAPQEASKAGLDGAVCGDCPRRHSLGGDCYVTLFQAPRSVWASWDRAGGPVPNWTEEGNLLRLTQGARDHGLRLGSYGDPAAVPFDVWDTLLEVLAPRMHTGYTHQWNNRSQSIYQERWLRENVMASCDTPEQAAAARADGWRYFMAMAPGTVPPERTIECMAERDVNPRTCEECGICNGSQGRAARASVYILEHGARSTANHKRGKRSPMLQVMQ